MGKSKAPLKKQQQRGVDFKKIKRKVGRKLPPPKNVTNTEIKSKAIVLPEQSVASEKAGLAVSKKGLTLKELLQQTSHHNPKIRKDALIGIRDIFLNYPTELRLHKLAVIEKLRERISDDDKLVRETLYQLLKSVIFPGCREDNQGPFISLMMAYIFNAMTHLSMDVRLMAFKFFDLVVQHYPSSFPLYAEKIFQNYEDILRKNQFLLREKGKLKNVLGGLVHCLLLLPSNKGDHDLPGGKEAAADVLHAFEPEALEDPAGFSVIKKKLKELVPVLVSCFQDFIQLVHSMPHLDAQSFDCMQYILQSLDLVVRFFTYAIDNPRQEIQVSVPPEELDTAIQGQAIVLLLLKKLFDLFPLNPTHYLSGKEDGKYFVLNVMITEIFLHSSDGLCPPATFFEKFLEFIASALCGEISVGTQPGKAFLEKHLLLLIPFTPKLVLLVEGGWKSRILQAFTKIFQSCHPESSLKWACLLAVEEMLIPQRLGLQHLDACDPEVLDYQITWIRELPLLLNLLGDKHPLHSRNVLNLLLRIGQCAASKTCFVQEYDNMQYSFAEFYCTCMEERSVSYGPFIKLDRDVQELSICCLYYFSYVDSVLLKSLAWCCLYDGLEPFVIFRIVEILHSAYKVGHIQIADHISFFITLLSGFKVSPGKSFPVLGNDEISNRGTFKSITSLVCSCMLQMGDDYLVLRILEKVVLSQISLDPALDNLCALLRVLAALDSRPTRLSQQSIINLSNLLPVYLIDVVSCFPEDTDESTGPVGRSSSHYYLLPCFFLFYRSDKILRFVLKKLCSLVIEKRLSLSSCAPDHSSRIAAIVSLIRLMHQDVKIRKILSSCKAEIDLILQNILTIQSSEQINIIEERHKIQSAVDQLKALMRTLFSESWKSKSACLVQSALKNAMHDASMSEED
ncbi:uncharacterized protein LOC127806055 isoform X2 [Diospyros lotus]|uniref:uncharacterized protein LOC127806055 isoform X2 n=1 Tax=Diospyros lotus TaxID=55363 RepID=UPI002258D6C0|nr:uncharacterized protein LOC127806055 isoform X2 [Diospyros lotus]